MSGQGRARARSVASPPAADTSEPTYRGVTKRPWEKFAAEIEIPGKKCKLRLGTFDSAERPAFAYDVAASAFCGSKSRTNFSQACPILRDVHPPRNSIAPAFDSFFVNWDFDDDAFEEPSFDPGRPTPSSLSSTVESFSCPRPRSATMAPPASASKRQPRSPLVAPEDCHSGCDSSSSVADDCDVASSSLLRRPLQIDLNIPPLEYVEYSGDDLLCTDLCL